MIVRSLLARNFMRFEELRLTDIPEKGVIGIVGENESGKTTIMEAISFGLFGQTMKSGAEEYPRLIHWKASYLEVRLDIVLSGQHFRVVRRCDRQGGREAQLFEVHAEREEPVADGVERVNARLSRMMRLEFPVFSHSFYLGQKQLSHLLENRSGSMELMEQMTGLNRLRKVQAKVQAELPLLEDRIQTAQVKLHVARARIEHFAEQLAGRDEVATDLNRQKERLDEVEAQVRKGNEELGLLEEVKRGILGLRTRYTELQKAYFGAEFKRRLGFSSRDFLNQMEAVTRRRQEIEAESQKVHAELHEKTHGLESGLLLLESLRGLKLLMKDRARTISSNTKTQFGSQNIRSHFLPDTLKDKEVILERRMVEAEQASGRETRAYNIALVLLLAFLGGVSFLGVRFGVEQFVRLSLSWKLGLGLFLGSAGLLLGAMLAYKNRSLNDLKDQLGAIRMKKELVERELQEESSELGFLKDFEPESVRSMEDLRGLRQQLRSEPIKKVITGIMEEFQERPEAFLAPLKDLKKAEEQIREEEKADRLRHLESQTLRGIEEEYRSLCEELRAYSFLPQTSSSGEFSVSGVIARAREIHRLRELLQGDLTHSMEKVEIDLKDYRDALEQLISKVRGQEALLPANWDEKRLTWPYEFQSMLELDLAAVLLKARQSEEGLAYIDRLLEGWFERWQKKQEQTLTDEVGRQSSEHRIRYMQEELDRLGSVQKRRAETLLNVDRLEAELKQIAHDLKLKKVLDKLLNGTVDSLRARLSPNLSRFIGAILPQITSGRYSRVRVSLDLEIAVFSPEKEGFVDFTTLSGGTADQLLLCLHLAFASALIQSRFDESYRQFLFLDEPLAAFDSSRAHQFLKMVLSFHPAFGQVFLISHNTGLSDSFDAVILADGNTVLHQLPSRLN